MCTHNLFKITSYLLYVFMPVCVFMYTSHSIHVDAGEQLQESVISFHHGVSEPNPVIGLGTKHLCPLNHLIGSLYRHHFKY